MPTEQIDGHLTVVRDHRDAARALLTRTRMYASDDGGLTRARTQLAEEAVAAGVRPADADAHTRKAMGRYRQAIDDLVAAVGALDWAVQELATLSDLHKRARR